MKKIYTIIASLMLTASVFAQAPETMSYQAAIRDANNNLTTNQAIGLQISILQTTATGTAVYVETHTPTTNANGLVSLEIGTGTVVSGDFTTIDWANDTYFIKTETDPTVAGGTTYTITGTSQLMSVPYALHAKTAESIIGTVTEIDPIFTASIAKGITVTDTTNWNNHTIDTHIDSTGIINLGFVAGNHLDYAEISNLGFVNINDNILNIGDTINGGIIFYINNSGKHGLIVAFNSIGSFTISDNVHLNKNITGDGLNSGEMNTLLYMTSYTYNNSYYPAYKCYTLKVNYNGIDYGNWYLPSLYELQLLNSEISNVDINVGISNFISSTQSNSGTYIYNLSSNVVTNTPFSSSLSGQVYPIAKF